MSVSLGRSSRCLVYTTEYSRPHRTHWVINAKCPAMLRQFHRASPSRRRRAFCRTACASDVQLYTLCYMLCYAMCAPMQQAQQVVALSYSLSSPLALPSWSRLDYIHCALLAWHVTICFSRIASHRIASVSIHTKALFFALYALLFHDPAGRNFISPACRCDAVNAPALYTYYIQYSRHLNNFVTPRGRPCTMYVYTTGSDVRCSRQLLLITINRELICFSSIVSQLSIDLCTMSSFELA